MIALVKNNIKAIQDVCRKHHVKSLYLFGSASRDKTFTTESDVDFLYRFNKDAIVESEYADNFFEMLFELEDILRRKIDMVAEEKISNPYFMESINRDKELVYES
jgi:uncharacterized protein